MTMHQWESFQKLITKWEEQSVSDKFKYTRFDYKSDEWDNVPPVIPRFMFYMQNCIEKEVEFSDEINQRQTTAQLKDEIYVELSKHTCKLDDETKARHQNVNSLEDVDKRLQTNIDEII